MNRLIFVALPLLLAAGSAQAQHKPVHLKWMDGPPGLPAGAKFAVVHGDPSKEGMFTIRANLPANYTIPAHWHPTDEHMTVMSGKLAFGMGDKVDHMKAKWYNQGARLTAKAHHNHFVYTHGHTEIQVTAMGPFQITYVDPKDDPRGAQ